MSDTKDLVWRLRGMSADTIGEQAADTIERLTADLDAFKRSFYDELDSNLDLRVLGGAHPDEAMTPFLERVIAERDALRADAERWRYFVTHCEWIRHWPKDAERDEPYSYMLLRLPYGTDQSCVATRNAAIDAARTGSKT